MPANPQNNPPKEPPGTQMDLDMNQTDRAIRAVREYQTGKATTSFVRDSLAALPESSLLYVALATRVPETTLRKLRG